MKFQLRWTVLIFLSCLAWSTRTTSGSLDWLTGMLHRFGYNSGIGGYGGGFGGGYGYSGFNGYGSSFNPGNLLSKLKDLLGGKKYPQAHGSGWVGGGGPYTSAGFYGAHGGGFRPWYNNYNRLQFNRLGGHLFLR